MSVKGVLMIKAAVGVPVEALIARVPNVQQRWEEEGVAVHNAYPTSWNGDPNCAFALIQAPNSEILESFTEFVSQSPMVQTCRPFPVEREIPKER